MDKSIRIACQGSDLIPLDELQPLQGNLKTLSEEAYSKLRMSILELGFSFPVMAWRDPNNVALILDAHQRVTALKRMRMEGWHVPDLPVCWVEAQDLKEASRKLLAAASQYGEVSPQGLFEYMKTFDIGIDQMVGSFEFPEVDFKKFELAFFPHEETKTVSFEAKTSPMTEDEPTAAHQCPKCGYEFD